MIRIISYLQVINKDTVLKKVMFFSIFLSFFALFFSCTAAYYSISNEEKYKVINEIKKHQNLIQKISYKVLKNKFNLIREEKNSLNYFLTEKKNNSFYPIEEINNNYCSFMEQSIIISVFKTKQIMDFGKGYLTKAWGTYKLKKKYNFEYIHNSIIEISNLFLNKKFNLCKEKSLNEVKGILSEQIHIQDRMLFLVKDLKLLSKKRLDEAFNALNLNYSNSSKFILIAFIFQFMIFLIISFIDVRSVFINGFRK